MHHYYRAAQVPFVKTPWVRSMHLGVFTYFQEVAVKLFGNIPLGKGDDDGSVMEAVIKEKRFPAEARMVKWETLKEILEKYKVCETLGAAIIASSDLAFSLYRFVIRSGLAHIPWCSVY